MLTGPQEEHVREIARQEVASLVGLLLNRISETSEHRGRPSPGSIRAQLRSALGEALHDFGGTTHEPGPEPAKIEDVQAEKSS